MLAKLRQYIPFLPGGPPKPTAKQVLSLAPLRNPAVNWERTGPDNLVVISYTPRSVKEQPRLIDRLFGLPGEKKIELTDELSSAVWEMCDGKHTVAQIASLLADKYKLGRRQAEVSVLAFLRTLQGKRLVGVPVDQARTLTADKKKSAPKPQAASPKGSEGFYAARKELRKSTKIARHENQ